MKGVYMKRFSALLATVCTVLPFSAAHAQNSVTLYGVVDDGISYIHNSGAQSSQWKMSAGNLSGDRWGIKGSEDLSGGLVAIFRLESGFDINSGQPANNNRLFGRLAIVGLASKQYGTLSLGRQYDPVTDVVQPITADNYSGVFAPPGDIDNYDDSARFDNAVKWTSPNWSGATLEAMYALGGVADSVASGQTWSAGASFNAGSLTAAAGFLHVDNGNARTATRGTTTADSFFNSPVNLAYASASGINIIRVGAQYVAGSITAGGAYSYTQYSSDAASAFRGSEHFQNGSAFLSWMSTPNFQVVGGYNYTRSGGNSSATYHQANLGIDYILTKRTDVYLGGGYTHASGNNGQGPAEAVVGSFDVDSGARSQLLTFAGMRHRF
jgi:predicted porin